MQNKFTIHKQARYWLPALMSIGLSLSAPAQIQAIFSSHDDVHNTNRTYTNGTTIGTNMIYNGDFESATQSQVWLGSTSSSFYGYSSTSSNCNSPFNSVLPTGSLSGWAFSYGGGLGCYAHISSTTNNMPGAVPGNGTRWLYTGNGTHMNMANTTPISYNSSTGLFNMDAYNTGTPNYPVVEPNGGLYTPLTFSQSIPLIANHTYELEFFLSTEGAWQAGSCTHPVSLGLLQANIGSQVIYFGAPNTYSAMGVGERFHFRFKALSSGTYPIQFTCYGHNEPSASNNYANSLINASSYGVGVEESNEIIIDDISLNDVTITLSGNVYNDATGNSNNLVDGTGFNAPGGTPLYAVLVSAYSNQVLDATPVAADGSYSFTAYQNYSYKVVLSSTNPVIGSFWGSSFTQGNLPAGWNYTGEQLGTVAGVGFDATQGDGIYNPVTVGSTSVSNVNFGIQATAAYTISGNVWHDVNGGNVNNSYGTLGVPSGIYAVLQNSSYQIIASTTVNTSTGYYEFTNIPAGTYSVQIQTTVPGAVGSTAPWPVSPPSGWTFTGEYYGAPNTGNDGSIDGWCQPNIAVSSNTSNINFGIQQIPTAGTTTLATQTNPGGTVNVSVPASSFSGTDDGTATSNGITNIKITGFPTNATSITINGTTYTSGTFPVAGVTIPANASGQPTQAVSVDPVDGAVTVNIPYQTIDILGATSANGAVNVPLGVSFTISGNVWHDVNGGNVNNSYGTLGVPSGIYAELLSTSLHIIASTTVNTSTGYYEFTNIPADTYTVQIQTVPGSIGSVAVWPIPPSGWTFTGEFYGAPNTGNDGTIDGWCLPYIIVSNNISNINFGIQQIPTAGTTTLATQTNPGGTTNVSAPASSFSGTDDGTATSNGITNIKITGFPTNATSITINGTTYTSGTFPVAGVTIPANASGQPTQAVSVDPVDGAVTVSIPYQTIDILGATSGTGAVNMPFRVPVKVSGNVWDDKDGGNVNNSNAPSTVIPTGLYAVLQDASYNVIASIPVDPATGYYEFSDVTPGTNYSIQIQTSPGVLGTTSIWPVTAPAGWVFTGEYYGTPNSGNDGNADGWCSNLFTVALSDITNVNFGIEQIPVATNKAWVVNNSDFTLTQTIGGVVYKGIPATNSNLTGYNSTNGSLSGTDAEDCATSNSCNSGRTFIIKTIDPNTALFYNGVQITAGQTISNFDVTKLEVYGQSGTTNPNFTYTLQDAAGVESAAATYGISATTPLPLLLRSFTAEVSNCTVSLQWITEAEQHIDRIVLEYSDNGAEYQALHTFQPYNTDGQHEYTYSQSQKTPVHYYRLAVYTTDQAVQYSTVLKVTADCTDNAIGTWTIQPNPISTMSSSLGLHYQNISEQETIQIQIYNMLGQVMARQKRTISDTDGRIDLPVQLSSGQYLVHITNTAGQQVILKAIVQ